MSEEKKPIKTLYFGLNPNAYLCATRTVTHCPLIQVRPFPLESSEIQRALTLWPQFTHCIFTSQNGVKFWLKALDQSKNTIFSWQNKEVLAVGKATANALVGQGIAVTTVAQEETAEGIIQELSRKDLSSSYVFWPHSALSRTIITDYLRVNKISYFDCQLYTSLSFHPQPLPSLAEYDELIFTSPSIIDSFLQIYGLIPTDKVITCIGPVTYAYLQKHA
ncbi:MAG: hemD [Chlamydiales bacterium]|jgi:uroporphyrinogen-III synthase|nr:hemD [Chlamydiales bacterium]